MQLTRLRAFWRALTNRSVVEGDLNDEIRHHLEMQTALNEREGMAPDEARRRAYLVFGGVEAAREAHRDGRGTRWLNDFAGDVRYAFRVLRRSPALTAAAVVTLGLGIGANTAIFSAVNAVVLRPLPFRDPGRLVMLWEENPDRGWHLQDAAPANMLDWKDGVRSFQDVAGYLHFGSSSTLTGQGEPRRLPTTYVTGNFFDVLGVRPALGRGFTDAETWKQPGAPDVALLTDRTWRDLFGADPGVVGRSVRLDGEDVQIVGVLPASFDFPGVNAAIWMPVSWAPTNRGAVFFRRAHFVRVVARLRVGATPVGANAELQAVVRRLELEYPQTNTHMGAGLTPLHAFLIGDTRRPLLVLLGAVAVLLLLACINVGNLMLVQATGREREGAMRLALGAGRGRLARQALTESLVLSAIGGAVGLAIGWGGTRALVAMQPAGLLPVRNVGVSWGVLAYVLLIVTVCGLIFGIAPALWNLRRRPVEVLKEGGRGGTVGRRVRAWSDGLVIGEVALALLLTLGAGLLVRSYQRVTDVSPGFRPEGMLTASVQLPGTRYDSAAQVIRFYRELTTRVRALPAVQEAGLVSTLSLTSPSWSSDFHVAGRPADDFGSDVVHREADPGYLRAMGLPLIAGRFFTDADQRGAERVVVINQTLARKYFANESPMGQRLAFDRTPDSSSTWRTIVGVIGDERQASLEAATRPEIFAPVLQDVQSGMYLTVRTSRDPAALAGPVRRIVLDMDPSLAVSAVRTMVEIRQASLAMRRFVMTLFAVFAAVGLCLAVVGVYGVVAHLARGRTREMGIRIALGARSGAVQWIVVRHGLTLVTLGIAAGAVASVVATIGLEALLYGVGRFDGVTFVAVPATLLVTALAATWLPAVRASRANPVDALRAE